MRPLPIALLLALPLSAPLTAEATLNCAATARYLGLITGEVTGENQQSGTSSCHAGLFDGSVGVAAGTANAALGVLKVDVHADTIHQVPFFETMTFANAGASWMDRFTINAPGMSNSKFGLFDFSVTISGQLDSHAQEVIYRESPSNLANWHFSLSGGSPAFGIPTGVFASLSGNGFDLVRVDGEDNLMSWSLVLTGQIRFRFSTEQPLNANLNLRAQALQEESSIDLFFGNSAYWGGITAVRDANGALLSLAPPGQAPVAGQYGMTTLSGIDWHPSMVPVPEPTSAGLLLLGLPLILRLRPGARRPS